MTPLPNDFQRLSIPERIALAKPFGTASRRNHTRRSSPTPSAGSWSGAAEDDASPTKSCPGRWSRPTSSARLGSR